jgi:hypothetical protein
LPASFVAALQAVVTLYCVRQRLRRISVWLNVIGWTATAVFSTSYFFKQAATLRYIQAAAALLWVIYGVAIHSAPVVVANLIVGIAALITSLRLALNSSASKSV